MLQYIFMETKMTKLQIHFHPNGNLEENVADGRASECMDPEGNGVSSGRGAKGGGGLAHLARSKISSWSATVEEKRLPWGNQEDNRMGPTWHQEPITHRVRNIVNEWPLFCMYIVEMTNVNMAWYLTTDYLFQENKSYGSKKPFAFILWCTHGSCQAQK
jgi:hypothetical protein